MLGAVTVYLNYDLVKGLGVQYGVFDDRKEVPSQMTDEEKPAWDGVERRKHNLLVLPSNRGSEEPARDKSAAVEEAIQSLLDIKGMIGRIFVIYESLDGKSLGCVDSALTAEQVLMMIETFKHWLLSTQSHRAE